MNELDTTMNSTYLANILDPSSLRGLLYFVEFVIDYGNEQWIQYLSYIGTCARSGVDQVTIYSLYQALEHLRDIFNNITELYRTMCESIGYEGMPITQFE